MGVDDLTPQQREELNRRYADRAYDQNADYIKATNETIVRDAATVVRSLILINGGAAISILTFVGALAGKAEKSSLQISEIAVGLTCFAIGVAIAVLIASLSYVVNFLYVAAASTVQMNWEHPYVHKTAKAKRLEWWGKILHVSAVVLAPVSLIFFVGGIIAVGRAVANLGG